MALVVRTDLSMQKGKIASQVAHAAVQLVVNNRDGKEIGEWLSQGQPKIVLKVTGLEELAKIQSRASELGVKHEAIMDAGNTQVPRGSLTVLGIGPAKEETLSQIVGHLKLL